MLSTLYVATTLSAWILTGIGIKVFNERIKNEGYSFPKKEKSKSEKILDNTRTAFYMLTPGLNFLVGYLFIFKFEEIYSRMTKEFIKEGKLVKDESKEEIEIDLQTKEMNNPKKYSELSNDKKLELLEAEKKRLLRQKEFHSQDKTYNDRGAYFKKRN